MSFRRFDPCCHGIGIRQRIRKRSESLERRSGSSRKALSSFFIHGSCAHSCLCSPSCGCCPYFHEIVSGAPQRPLGVDLFFASKEELIESSASFHLAEDRFGKLLSESVDESPLLCSKLSADTINKRKISRRSPPHRRRRLSVLETIRTHIVIDLLTS